MYMIYDNMWLTDVLSFRSSLIIVYLPRCHLTAFFMWLYLLIVDVMSSYRGICVGGKQMKTSFQFWLWYMTAKSFRNVHKIFNNKPACGCYNHCLQVRAWPGPTPSWSTICADDRDHDNRVLLVSRSGVSQDVILTSFKGITPHKWC